MIAFKKYIAEFRSNVPQGQPIDKEMISSWIKDANQLSLAIPIPGEKDIVIFEYNDFGMNDKFFLLADRLKREKDIVGYMWISKTKSKIYWQVMDVIIYDPYKRKGIGTDLYVKIINEGYNLINGFSLSSEVERVWRKLPQYVVVQTWNKETNEIEEMNEKPKEDIAINDDDQIYFWLASSKGIHERESMSNKGYPEYLNEWLLGNPKNPFYFRYNKFGSALEGDL